ncbi:MAG: exodeoxyribonuclease III [Actinomycetes bacterium]|jgi:exodeoxyribonuclease-3|nr:exodeoxyribonuclease III [Actinomycetes bacterium]
MKLVSWNVNGLRAAMKHGFAEVFATLDADAFCLQETKLQEGQLELELPGYQQMWSYAQKKGYSGTAVFVRSCFAPAAMRVRHFVTPDGGPEGPNGDLDCEGRVTACDLGDFWLVDTYTPNAQPGLARLDFRMRWEDAFRAFVSELDAQKPVVICGDLNVAHEEIDLARPKPNIGNPGFSWEERGKMTELLDAGFVDVFRERHPDLPGAYTWWSYRANARANNVGWRIDYFLCSKRLVSQVAATPLYPEITGSDHCPIGLELA